MRLAVVALVAGCNATPPPVVVTFDTPFALDVADLAVDAWRELGFQITVGDPGAAPACAQRWFAHDDVCEIRVRVRAVGPEQLAADGVGRAVRGLGEVWILDGTARPDLVLAHELGHILLDTGEHVSRGLMSANTANITPNLTAEDRALACRVAAIGC